VSVEEIKTRFKAEIDRRAFDDQYVDCNEEREIVQIALQLGMAPTAAHTALAQVCTEETYVLESEVVKQIRAELETAAASRGGVAREDFDRIVALARTSVRDKQNERYVKKLIVQVLEDAGTIPVRTGWLRNWYKALKKELGMA
jgi:hypothetical protein